MFHPKKSKDSLEGVEDVGALSTSITPIFQEK
jgi:hypothetical protein